MPGIITLSIDNSEKAHIQKKVYRMLHENFIYADRHSSEGYMLLGKITFVQLRNLCRRNNFNYTLFFAAEEQLTRMIASYNKQLFGTIDNKEIIAGTRSGPADIRAIRWIIADLISKKALYKKYGNKTKLTQIVKFLSSSKNSVPDQAEYILNTVGVTRQELWVKRSKREAYKYLCKQLATAHIHVATEANNCMPQNVPSDLDLSGIYIRDNFNPILFICNEISGHPDEGLGRKIYTLVFLLVSIFKGQSFAISIGKDTYSVNTKMNKNLDIIHQITNEILLPAKYFNGQMLTSKSEIIKEAERLKVSPTALLVRLRDLKKLGCDYKSVKSELADDFRQFVAKNKEAKAEARKRGDFGGPTPKTMYKSYQGDFVDFIKTNVPVGMREQLFQKHIVYGRSFIEFGEI